MKPAPTETAELLHRVRQQLILAQVRIMELEDVRDELAPKLADTEKLLDAAQTLADQKQEEAEHLGKVRHELQAQYEHMRHMQHVTNEALNQARAHMDGLAANLAMATKRAADEEQRGSQLQKDIGSLTDQLARSSQEVARVNLDLVESTGTAAARLERLNTLEAEIRAMKFSRSWRWTTWLRSLERSVRRGPG